MKQTQTIALWEQIQARNQMLLDSQLIFLSDEHIGRELVAESDVAAINPEKMLLSKIEYGLFFVKSLRFAETHPAEEIIKSRVNEKKPGGIASAEKSQ